MATPSHGPPDGSRSVQALQNQVSSGSIMTTAPSRSISTAPMGVKSDVDSNSIYNITVQGAWHQTLQHTENSNSAENRRSSSMSASGLSPRVLQGGETLPFSPSLESRLAAPSTPPPAMEGSGLGITAVPSSLPTPISTTLAGYGECFNTVQRLISVAYNTLYDTLRHLPKRVIRSKLRRFLYVEIETQKSDYWIHSTSLIVALSNIETTVNHGGSSTLRACHKIYSALCALWDHLHQVLSLIKAMASTDACEVSVAVVWT